MGFYLARAALHFGLMLLLMLGACHAAVEAAPEASVAPAVVESGLSIRFERVRNSVAFDAVVRTAGGAPPQTIAVSVDRGSAGPVRRVGDAFRARITPAGSGHYIVTARAGEAHAQRVALVLGFVDDAWGQPEPVAGLVNTLGWEDGASISADGRILSVHYLPVSINCVTGGRPNDRQACRVRGPVAAPFRPDMQGASRVRGARYRNGCPSVGAPSLPMPVPPNTIYAFTRDEQGAFSQPRPWFIGGIDGCVSIFGPELQEDGRTLIYALDDAASPGVGARIFSATIDPGAANEIARYARGPVLATHRGVALGGATAGVAGNPHRAELPDGRTIVFFDDEQGRRDLFASVAPRGAGFGEARLVPAPVSMDNAQESQPFFDGRDLYFRRDLVVLASRFSGGDPGAASSWGPARQVLTPGGEAGEGAVIVIGEPSIATVLAPRELYFIYARRTADGTLDLDVGLVRART